MIHARIFKANDIRGVATGPDAEWDAAGAYAIGAATADVFEISAGSGALVVGRDMRTTSPELSAAFADGVLSRGADVVDIGLASTDGLWFASGSLGLPGAMFTASHNPGSYNGIKFCHPGAQPVEPAELVAIRDRALARWCRTPAARPGTRTEQDLLGAYADHLLSLVDLSGIRRLKVVVDAGNGMGGLTTPAVLAVRTWRSSVSTSTWTAASRTTRRIRWSRPTWWTPRRRCVSTAPIWRWCSTVTPTAAS